MVNYFFHAAGEPDLSKLSPGVAESNQGETKNLGELVREAKRKYGSGKKRKDRSKEEKGYGIYRVSKHRNNHYQRGWAWRYIYKGKNKTYDFTSLDILELKAKVRLNHLMWRIYDEDLARKTAKEAGVSYDRLL